MDTITILILGAVGLVLVYLVLRAASRRANEEPAALKRRQDACRHRHVVNVPVPRNPFVSRGAFGIPNHSAQSTTYRQCTDCGKSWDE